MDRRRNLVLVSVGIALVAFIGIIGAFRPHGPTLDARVEAARRAHFSTTLPETGVVQRPRTQVLPALVGGNIGTITVRAGDRVKSGQVVATLVNPQVESSLATAQSAYDAAASRAQSAVETNSALPAQNRSAVVQAQANLLTSRAALQQARQDLAAGQQSGLGYSGTTADDLRTQAQAAVAKADTDLSEAQRTNNANSALYNQGAISRDLYMQTRAKLDEARVDADQAHRSLAILNGQLSRQHSVLIDRVHAAEDAVRQSQAALDAAQANAAESRAGDVGAAQGDAAKAGADLKFARDQVDRLTIRAPFAGIVQTIASEPNDPLRPLQPGDAIQAGQALVTIAGDHAFVVRTKVDEQDIAAVHLGQRARVSGEDFGGKSLPGHVAQIADVAQKSDDPSNTSRQVITTVALDGMLPFLRDGMTVDVDITTHDVPNVISVANDAIRHGDDGKPYVYVLRDGKAHRAPITTSTANDQRTIVTGGLGTGDAVVADKNPAVAEGAAIRPLPSPSPAVATTSPKP